MQLGGQREKKEERNHRRCNPRGAWPPSEGNRARTNCWATGEKGYVTHTVAAALRFQGGGTTARFSGRAVMDERQSSDWTLANGSVEEVMGVWGCSGNARQPGTLHDLPKRNREQKEESDVEVVVYARRYARCCWAFVVQLCLWTLRVRHPKLLRAPGPRYW